MLLACIIVLAVAIVFYVAVQFGVSYIRKRSDLLCGVYKPVMRFGSEAEGSLLACTAEELVKVAGLPEDSAKYFRPPACQYAPLLTDTKIGMIESALSLVADKVKVRSHKSDGSITAMVIRHEEYLAIIAAKYSVSIDKLENVPCVVFRYKSRSMRIMSEIMAAVLLITSIRPI